MWIVIHAACYFGEGPDCPKRLPGASIFYRLAGIELGESKDTLHDRFPSGKLDYYNNELSFSYVYNYTTDDPDTVASVHVFLAPSNSVNSIEWQAKCNPPYSLYVHAPSCEQLRSRLLAIFGSPTQHEQKGDKESFFFNTGGFPARVVFIDYRPPPQQYETTPPYRKIVPPPVPRFNVEVTVNRFN